MDQNSCGWYLIDPTCHYDIILHVMFPYMNLTVKQWFIHVNYSMSKWVWADESNAINSILIITTFMYWWKQGDTLHINSYRTNPSLNKNLDCSHSSIYSHMVVKVQIQANIRSSSFMLYIYCPTFQLSYKKMMPLCFVDFFFLPHNDMGDAE